MSQRNKAILVLDHIIDNMWNVGNNYGLPQSFVDEMKVIRKSVIEYQHKLIKLGESEK